MRSDGGEGGPAGAAAPSGGRAGPRSGATAIAPATPGLPVSPNGGPIAITWDNGPNKIVDLDYQA